MLNEIKEMLSNMGGPVLAVVSVLTIQALLCIAVVIDRLILLTTSHNRSKKFAAEAGSLLERGDHESVLKLASETKGSHLAQFMYTGLRTFVERREQGFTSEKAGQFATRALERKGESVSESLNKGMNILASTGSTAPFIGLLGTVLGILNAFKMIAESGSGGLGTIGASIGEALVVTGYGLTIAIPSVLVFNWLSGKIAHYETGLVNSGHELVDQLESGIFVPAEEAPEQSSVPARATGVLEPA